MATLKELMAKRSPESQAKIEEKAAEMLLETQLYQIREALALSQTQVAKNLGIAQSSVAAIEQRGNELKISTLKKYIEAMGGEMTLGVKLPDGKLMNFSI
ncbi:XRE family transcriptional regulator [Xenorhabdus nematophila]|uniref:Cro-like protein n=1 Tax=Xenorhabdus nematophila (strain ATCC 19061 / DSM 3370 / CCUG 14189 / LMG 1036 / NCIMB 9965 / AN6) TaxID=406817 RepID=D3VIU3_XENNA|nr:MULTISPECIES: helix-turn-helix domain-containing protein [Xenorhabdus]CEE94535.1 Cro-like protein [Xenorhabdus nematophila str. Anatoliense]CEF29183.1 Cro-like protein [Xenorhabdus nematophila str. Websteri]AYA41256.1 helix-turn-helix domain-containing protein [Xenorhabdus nematophila]MBA0019992.1 XRE family transcriptional regulator [Xenorhabdus nematophila]MCB4426818.1 XRE family transcriptional regulator [Xenorhabdus nematophila]